MAIRSARARHQYLKTLKGVSALAQHVNVETGASGGKRTRSLRSRRGSCRPRPARQFGFTPYGGKVVKNTGTYNGEPFPQTPDYADQNHNDFCGHERAVLGAKRDAKSSPLPNRGGKLSTNMIAGGMSQPYLSCCNLRTNGVSQSTI